MDCGVLIDDKLFTDLDEKRIIVTGGSGFIGSHLVDYLVEKNASVLVIDDMNAGNSNNLDKSKEKIKLVIGSIYDNNLVTGVFSQFEPDCVFHLAARSLAASLVDPVGDANVSIVGLLNILECVRKTKTMPLLIHSSTGSVYGEPSYSPQDESHTREPTSPYGVAKLAAEEYLRVWRKLYGLKFVGLRYYNVYGPRQSGNETRGGVIPIFGSRILKGRPIFIDGSGKQKRCFTYITDVVRANILAQFQNDAMGFFFNIASDEQTDILSLARLMMQISSKNVTVKFRPERLGEIMTFAPSINLAREKLRYEPRVSLKEGLMTYLNWLKEHIN